MCQRGAIKMAQQGVAFKEILWRYYSGVEIDGEKEAPKLEGPSDLQEALKELGKARAIIKTASDVLGLVCVGGMACIERAEGLILAHKCEME